VRARRLVGVLVLVLALLSACGDDEPSTTGSDPDANTSTSGDDNGDDDKATTDLDALKPCDLLTGDDAAALIGEPAFVKGTAPEERAVSNNDAYCIYAPKGTALLDPNVRTVALVKGKSKALVGSVENASSDTFSDPGGSGATVTRIDDLGVLAWTTSGGDTGDWAGSVSFSPNGEHVLGVVVEIKANGHKKNERLALALAEELLSRLG
jgi:hypothetical protein